MEESLSQFLRNHVCYDNNNITHTRIGNTDLGIFSGKYTIGNDDLDTFYSLYHKKVFIDKKPEFLTERQHKDGSGPILIDMDFRYDDSIVDRQHDQDTIVDIVQLYIEKIKDMMTFKTKTSVHVYVSQKPYINTSLENVTKDGIHIVISLKMDHAMQSILRKKVLEDLDNVLSELPLTNSYEDVLDEGITLGHTAWQLYGSRKPMHDAYELTNHFVFTFDKSGKYTDDERKISTKKHNFLYKVSARNVDIPSGELREMYKEEYEKQKDKTKTKKASTVSTGGKKIQIHNVKLEQLETKDQLEAIVNTILSSLTNQEYIMRETHKYMMALPEKYYNSFEKWIRVGWALKNCDTRLFYSWMLFSSKSEKFQMSDIPGYYEEWSNFREEGLTERSIMYWCKEDNPEQYHAIRKDTIDHYINITLNHTTEWDIANVLYQLFKDTFRCASLKNNTWFYYKKHRWHEIEKGSKLRMEISRTLSNVYVEKSTQFISKTVQKDDDTKGVEDNEKNFSSKCMEIADNLKRSQFKQNIMREATEIFYENDHSFAKKLDNDPYLLCFTNGVFDFRENVFRPGKPDDYVSLCTNIKYIPFSKRSVNQKAIKAQIDLFMSQLFPSESLRDYMWEHFASTLIGVNKPQTFNIYNGCGRNGKSKMIDLMTKCLGDYKGSVPTSLVTEKRGGVGSLTPEIAQLKGIRYAVMQEPSKGAKLNDGVMKELTGEDPIMANPKYKDPIIFVPQFKLTVCTNTLFEIKSNDDGTWRRIRICEYISKFVKEPSTNEKDYEFLMDVDIDKKFESWKEVFMALLVEIAKERKGNVKDCHDVLKASDEYRKDQDYFMQFVKDKVEKRHEPGPPIKPTMVTQVFKEWYISIYGKAVPKGKELFAFMIKQLGKNWMSEYRIIDDDDYEQNEFNDSAI